MRTLSKKIMLLLILFASSIAVNYSMIQPKNNSNIMKYNLNKKCLVFINEIENLYKSKIIVKEKELKEPEHGWSIMENDVPVIEINIKEKDKEVILIHEAYHLKLRQEGFPGISFEFPNNSESNNNSFYLEWFCHLFWDKIAHYYFYPLMLNELKINPYNSSTTELKEIYKNGKIEGLKDSTREIGLAGYYLQVWVETQNENSLKKFKSFLIDKYNGQGIEQGEELISLFKKKQISNSSDALELFIECFNLIHKNQNIKISTPIIEKEIHKNYVQYIAKFKFV